MSNNGSGPVFAHPGRFDFTVTASDDNISISRPVSREDVERVRRQIAEWQARSRPAKAT